MRHRFTLSFKNNHAYDLKQKKSKTIAWFGVIFGLAGIFVHAGICVPIGLIFSIFSIFSGHIMIGIMGLMTNFIGILASVKLMLLIGKIIFFLLMGLDIVFDKFDDSNNLLGLDI